MAALWVLPGGTILVIIYLIIRVIMKNKKLTVFKVVCSACGKTRYWNELSDSPIDSWECNGIHTHTHTQVKVTEVK